MLDVAGYAEEHHLIQHTRHMSEETSLEARLGEIVSNNKDIPKK